MSQVNSVDESKGPFTKDVQLIPGEGVCGIRTFNCYSSVILLFYRDAGGKGGLETLVLAGRHLRMAPKGFFGTDTVR